MYWRAKITTSPVMLPPRGVWTPDAELTAVREKLNVYCDNKDAAIKSAADAVYEKTRFVFDAVREAELHAGS